MPTDAVDVDHFVPSKWHVGSGVRIKFVFRSKCDEEVGDACGDCEDTCHHDSHLQLRQSHLLPLKEASCLSRPPFALSP